MSNRLRLSVLLGCGAIAAAALSLGACANREKAGKDSGSAMTASNTVCPVSGRAMDPEAPTREYKGRTVGFCCDDCPKKWDTSTDAQRDAMLEKAAGK